MSLDRDVYLLYCSYSEDGMKPPDYTDATHSEQAAMDFIETRRGNPYCSYRVDHINTDGVLNVIS